MVPLVLGLNEAPDIESVVCVTAQHRELLDQVLEPFGIHPQYDLNIMSSGQSLHDITSRVLVGLRDVLGEVKPGLLLVHGDTTTTFAASLAAFYAHISIGHVEAGLRSHEKYLPYPEEINRKLTTALTDIHFAPTGHAKKNLLNENVPDNKIYVTGNTQLDLIKYAQTPNYVYSCKDLETIDYSKRIILMTAHRRENWGVPLEGICRAAKRLVEGNPDTYLVYPMHPNPLVQETAKKILSGAERVLLTNHINIFDLYNLMKKAYIVMSDSGGFQEEAPAFGKPLVVLRDVTERPEGIEANTLVLAGVKEDSVYNAALELLTNNEKYSKMANAKNPFGDGEASRRIIAAIRYEYGLASDLPDVFMA